MTQEIAASIAATSAYSATITSGPAVSCTTTSRNSSNTIGSASRPARSLAAISHGALAASWSGDLRRTLALVLDALRAR